MTIKMTQAQFEAVRDALADCVCVEGDPVHPFSSIARQVRNVTPPQCGIEIVEGVLVPKDAYEWLCRAVQKHQGKPDDGRISPERLIEIARAAMLATKET